MTSDTDTPTLHSTYALDQLTRVAGASSDLFFAQMLLPVFEAGIPAPLLIKLKTALKDNAIANPLYQVTEQNDASVSYDEQTRTITVARQRIEDLQDHPDTSCTLLTSMIEAFALHINTVLREDLADKQDDGSSSVSAPLSDEFAGKYLATLMFMDEAPGEGTTFADYSGPAYQGSLQLTLPPLTPSTEEEQASRAKRKKRFAAGPGNHTPESFGHASVESAGLTAAGFDHEQCRRVYFGNWLRDFSQLIDPKLVRAPGAAPEFPAMFSREALTELIDVLAVKEFHELQDTDQGRADYKVTPQVLGVYRPCEHIDNPVSLDDEAVDPKTIDPDFDALVRQDDAINCVHPKHSVQMHFRQAFNYMALKLDTAAEQGMTPAGLRSMGEALHVLEDLYAHSNYVELCLRKLGFAEVAVWTTPHEHCKHALPVVTGLFSGLDVLSSIAEPMAKMLFPTDGLDYRKIEPGERTDSEKMLLIMLEDRGDHEAKEALEMALEKRDQAAGNPMFQAVHYARWLQGLPLNAISYAKNLVLQPLVKWAGDNVGNLQTLTGDPNVDDACPATHSQLAKDHDTHPLHGLAALLAQQAVERVGRAMHERWNGNDNREPAHLAKSYFVHPNDTGWYESLVKTWAEANPEKIEQSSKHLEMIKQHEEARQASLERIRDLGKGDSGYQIQQYSEALSMLGA